MLHPRQVMIRDVLLDRVWGSNYFGDRNLIEVHISALRDTLGDHQRTFRDPLGNGLGAVGRRPVIR